MRVGVLEGGGGSILRVEVVEDR
eukprot:COSAG02_NODE_55018_length_293_cov_0.427835_2_plen_22_part_01